MQERTNTEVMEAANTGAVVVVAPPSRWLTIACTLAYLPPLPRFATEHIENQRIRAGQPVVPEVLRKSGSARCREDNFSRLIA